MPRKAVLEPQSHLTNDQKEIRERVSASLCIGTIDDYEPSNLSSDGLVAYNAILASVPREKLAAVDGFTVEIAASALAQMFKASRAIEDQGLVIEKTTSHGTTETANPYIAIFAKYAEIARKYLAELGCTPSARSKIAADASAAMSNPKVKGVRAILAEIHDDDSDY